MKALYDLEDKLEQILKQSDTGIIDGHDIAVDGSHGFVYMYGTDAERLFKIVLPVLTQTVFMKHAIVTIRYGNAISNAKEREVRI